MYEILFNNTLVPSVFLSSPESAAPMDRQVVSLKLAIDTAILNYERKYQDLDSLFEIDLTIQEYPHVRSRFLEGYDVVAMTGGFYFYIPPMIVFVVLLTEIVREKEKFLRIGMSLIGMSNTAFWLSWAFYGVIFTMMVSIILILSGRVCNFDVFNNVPFEIIFIVYSVFGFAMVLLAFLLSTCISRSKTAYTVSYGFLLAGMVLEWFFWNIYL